ncbi:lytic transglycosylase domain-containing protein [bacterium]|nr:lytic transglycosylase domain-containing protein [bacterium]
MKKLLLIALMLIGIVGTPAYASDINTIKASIVKHAHELGVDPAIALSIARTESGFRHEARSSYGAVGVFQLMPSTAKRMGLNPYLLNDNIKGGIMYYKMMYKMFGSMELALAAYNAGPGNVKKYNAIPPFTETKRFVNKIMTDYNNYKKNPDPAMLAATKAGSKAGGFVPPEPTVENQQLNEIKVEVIEEAPIELEIEATTIAI